MQYIAIGAAGQVSRLNDRYGLHATPRSAMRLQEDVIYAGVKEIARGLRPGGLLLVKCKDYVCGGQLHPATNLTVTAASQLGMRLVDRFEHVEPWARGRNSAKSTLAATSPRSPFGQHAWDGVESCDHRARDAEPRKRTTAATVSSPDSSSSQWPAPLMHSTSHWAPSRAVVARAIDSSMNGSQSP